MYCLSLLESVSTFHVVSRVFVLLSAVVDIFVNSKLERPVTCSVEHIYIRLSSALDKFETSLCNSVLEDYCRHNGKQVQGQAQVSKRCLRVE